MDNDEILETLSLALDELDSTLLVDLPRWAQKGNQIWKQNSL